MFCHIMAACSPSRDPSRTSIANAREREWRASCTAAGWRKPQMMAFLNQMKLRRYSVRALEADSQELFVGQG
jgi:hypothetical protein